MRRSTLASWTLVVGLMSLPAAALELEPCEIPGFEGEARCGTYEVFEDRAAATGRKIALNIVLLPARGENPQPDPVVFFAGGPGGATTDGASGVATFYGADLEHRDFLLVDYRGTGKSNPLFCPYQQEDKGVAEALSTFIPVDRLEECVSSLEGKADPRLYTTPNIVDDVAEVSRALGYDKVNLSGGSYGSRAVLVYMRRHPESVRTALIEGVAPTDARIPVTFATDAQAALDGWFRECAEDAACAAAFPDPEGDLRRVLAELDQGPKVIEVIDPKSGETVELELSRNAFVQALRYMLYDSLASLKIPAFVNAAAKGDWEPMAQTTYSVAGLLLASLPDGLYLSVTCTEDTNRIGPNAAAIQTGFLGDFRLSAQVEACEEWVEGELPADFFEPVESSVPILIISGERDPVTPARWGYQVQEFLPNSKHLVVPNGAHGWFGLEGVDCADGLVSALLESGDVSALDVEGCRDSITRPDFLLEIPRDEEVEMTAEELARFAGTYAIEGGGFQTVLEVTDAGLMGTFGEDTSRFVPLGGLRFKIAGEAPGNYFDFVEADGRIVALEVVRGGAAQFKLVRR